MNDRARITTAFACIMFGGCGTSGRPASTIPSSPSPEPAVTAPPEISRPTPVPRAIVEGDYEVTFSAQNCLYSERPLPPELRRRTFLMRVVQVGAVITVLEKASLRIPIWDTRALWGEIASDGRLSLTNYYGNEQWDVLWDQVTPERGVGILVESMRVAISPDGLLTDGTFAGFFESRGREEDVIESECLSTSHSVKFVRRETQ
jgi:hypothetical protein